MRKQQLKDFQYYADQAESILIQTFQSGRPKLLAHQETMVAAADVYAKLAAAAAGRENREGTRSDVA